MNLKNKIIVCTLFTLLLVPLALAECPPDCQEDITIPEQEYDPYQDPGFYTSSNPSDWDWDQVDWNFVDFGRAELYTNNQFYQNLPEQKYSNLDYQQTDYNNEFFNHDLVDPVKYLADLKCKDCTLYIKGMQTIVYSDKSQSYQQGEIKVTYSKEGIRHMNGKDFAPIPGGYPIGISFEANAKELLAKFPEKDYDFRRFKAYNNYNLEEIKKVGDVYVFPDGTEMAQVDYITNGYDLEPSLLGTVTIDTGNQYLFLKDGKRIKGKVSFADNQFYIKSGYEATIIPVNYPLQLKHQGGYKISPENKDTYVYFSKPLEPQPNHLVITDTYLSMQADKDSSVVIEPQPGNKFFWMVKNSYVQTESGEEIISDFYSMANNDKLTIYLSGDQEPQTLEFSSREEEGKTPLVKHEGTSGTTIINSGRISLFAENGQVNIIPPEPLTEKTATLNNPNSVAFEFTSSSMEENEKIRLSSSNRYLYLVDNKPIMGNNLGLRVSDQISDNMVKTVYDLRYKYPKIEFSASYTSTNTIQVLNEWFEDKPGLEKHLDLSVGGTDIFYNVFTNQLLVDNLMTDPSTLAKKELRDIDSPLELLDHELTHNFDAEVFRRENKLNPQIGQGIAHPESLLSKYQEIVLGSSDRLYVDQEFRNMIKRTDELFSEIPSDITINLETTGGKTFSAFISKDLQAAEQQGPEKLREEQAAQIKLIDLRLSVLADRLESPELREEAKLLREKFNKKVFQDTGQYPYAYYQSGPGTQFNTNNQEQSNIIDFPPSYWEYSSTVAERKVEELPHTDESEYAIRLEVDRAHSLGINEGDPDYWIIEKAESRCEQYTGAVCAPCTIYTLTCKP
ncbi:hypothetical protein HOC13_01760 [Candidatus Woesearchaeota archaeon]|jgi:hypothetical protein|nr:hypothetical protein [Candidatus Woesearchaeota archaeon]